MSDELQLRRTLDYIDQNEVLSFPKAKRTKVLTAPSGPSQAEGVQILTFGVSHSTAQVQLLSTHTLYDLVDILCRETKVGDNESVDCHLWNIQVPDGRTFENTPISAGADEPLMDLGLSVRSQLLLNYDYVLGLRYVVTLLSQEPFGSTSQISSPEDFPRKKPTLGIPRGYIQYITSAVNLNVLFPVLNQWAFGNLTTKLHLFQPGKKNVHAFAERNVEGIRHFLHLPYKPQPYPDLARYLNNLNHAAMFAPSINCAYYGVVILEDSKSQRYPKYAKQAQPGICDVVISPPPTTLINDVFPKLAALASCGRKDRKIPRGWLSYEAGLLRICSGNASTVISSKHHPRGTAWEGLGQHEPEDEKDVLFQMETHVQSLHHLFCVAEGLLQTV